MTFPTVRRLFTNILLLTVLAGFALPGAALAKGNPRYASIVLDAETGVILHQSNADKSLHPASLVKMMTLLMTFEAIEKGQLGLRDRIAISRHAASMVPSKLGLDPGDTIRVEDAIYALVTKSANDIAVALAEAIGGGSEARFAVLMNRKAREIGMGSTRFVNASGLHHSQQVSTARDMARLAQYILRAYPQYYRYFSTRHFTYRGLTHRNHNRLMSSYRGMDGFKTGYVAASGFNLVASARRGDRRLIGVVFGGLTANSRNAHMAALLDRGFERVAQQTLLARAVPPPPRKPATLTRLASLEGLNTTPAGTAARNAVLQESAFGEMIGEGDYDPAASTRVETGLMAIAAVKGEHYVPVEKNGGDWAVQVGAFGSRARTDRALDEALAALPAALSGRTNAAIAPLKTARGWLFRARLTGFTQQQALDVCRLLKDCLPVSPQAY